MKYLSLVVLCVLLCVSSACRDTTDNATQTDIAGLQVFPADNPWNTDISQYPVHGNSDNFIASIGPDIGLHPDFGTVWEGAPIGIPYVVVAGTQPMVFVTFVAYGDESDPGPYPVPDNAPVEGGSLSDSDRHVIVVDKDRAMLYELYRAFKVPGGWQAGSGATWDLTSNEVRPKGWTSADAAGLPIFPGLVRYEEIENGEITHAIRFTLSRTQRGFIFPARHYASSSTDANLPPMGLRLRLKADYDISGFTATNRIILKAMKTYGLIVADNGADWFISGAPDSRWNDEDLAQIRQVKGKDFEVVYTGEIEQ